LEELELLQKIENTLYETGDNIPAAEFWKKLGL